MLPSLNHLKRCKVDEETSIKLFGKELCTIANNRGAYNVSLQHGVFMFSHETVLYVFFCCYKHILKCSQNYQHFPLDFFQLP